MIFQTYLVCWDDVHFNAVEIEENFKEINRPITVINSGNMKRDHWDNVGDIRYYRQFYHALKNFDPSYEYMAFICGDVSYSNWHSFIYRAERVLANYENIGVYAPHLTNEPWTETATKLNTFKYDENINIATNTDGICFIMHRDIVALMLDYFKYLEDNVDLKSMISGWGIDIIWSALSMMQSKLVLRDKFNIITHPAGSSYNHSRASEEVTIIMENFANFYKGDRKIFNLMDKIRGRMNSDPSCMDHKEYYPDDLEKIKINYHIIHIDDTRKSNRSKIDLILNSNKLPIESLNAREEANIEKFLKNNKEFKINWEGFKKGEFGNFGSHFLAWKHLLNSDLQNLLVFEDDAIIHEDFIDKYSLIIKNLPNDYDIMSVYVDPNQYDRFNQADYINEYISKGYQDWSTLCYIVSRQGAQKLINYVTTIGMDYPTDWFIFRRGHKGIYNVYTLPPTFQSPLEIDKQYESQVQ